MARFQRHSIHRRRSKRGNSLLILGLLFIGMLLIWVFTMDLESSKAFKWMTNGDQQLVFDKIDIQIYDKGLYGVPSGDSIPRWIASDISALRLDDTVIFSHENMGRSHALTIATTQLPLWNDYIRHARNWERDCDTLYVIYGQVPDTEEIYTINLCIDENSHGQAVLIPKQQSELPFFEFTRSIDEVEKLTNINFFGDLLDHESETYIERNHQRLRWLYPKDLYTERIEENKRLNDGHNE